MSELEELKARADEYDRKIDAWSTNTGLPRAIKADLDRAIAIAESRQVVEDVNEILAANARNVDERDKAIAAALALRGYLKEVQYSSSSSGEAIVRFRAWIEKYPQVLDETAWLEEHR